MGLRLGAHRTAALGLATERIRVCGYDSGFRRGGADEAGACVRVADRFACVLK